MAGLAAVALLGEARDGSGQSSPAEGQRCVELAEIASQVLTVSMAVAGDRIVTLEIELPENWSNSPQALRLFN